MAQEIAPTLRPAAARSGALAPLVPPRLGARVLALLWAWTRAHAELVTCSAVLLVALGHLGRVYNRGFNLLDEGFVLHVAERVLQGQVPYRDFFTQLTPGAFLALAAVFKVTGPSVIVGRWVTVLIGLLITALLYLSGRRILSRPSAALAALAFPVWGIGQGWFYPNYSWFALAGCMLALECTLRAVGAWERRRVAFLWAALAGLSCGVAAFCKQNMGLYTLVALAGALVLAAPGAWRSRLGQGLLMGLAALPVPLALLVWLAGHGALADFYRDAVWIPLAVFPREMAAPYPPVWPPWPLPEDPPGQGAWAFRLVCLLPPLPYGLTFARLAAGRVQQLSRRTAPAWLARAVPAGWLSWPGSLGGAAGGASRSPHPATQTDRVLPASEAVWLAFALAIWATAFPRADFDHIQVALGPAFVLGAAVLESVGRLAVRLRIWRLWGAPDAPDARDAPAASDDATRRSGRPRTAGVFAPAARLGIVFDARSATPATLAVWGARLCLALRRVDGAVCARFLPQALAGAVLCAFLLAGLAHARALHMGPPWTLRTLSGVAPRASGILLDHDDAAELRQLVQEVRRLSAPGESIVSLPWNAGLYFLAERRNASRYDLFIPASVLPEDVPEITAALDQARLIVYWTARDSFIENTSLDDRTPELHHYILSRYRAVAAVNAYRLLLRE